MADGTRLDVRLVELGLAQSRTNAQALIMAKEVLVNDQYALKASMTVRAADEIRIREKLPYVSRGGVKLERALDAFGIDVTGLVCLDVGASTGGFTDCLLQRGALRVYAVDVGHGQLDYSLRKNPNVISMEKYNARELKAGDIEPVSFACADVSFISLKLILNPIFGCLVEDGRAVVLIKPQFEAGRALIHRGGVVREPKVRAAVCLDMMLFAQANGFGACGLEPSPIKGPKGNEEYLLFLKKGPDRTPEQILVNLSQIAAGLE
jgi:23S rRNA (cytidine1920-2'-O)/16S rRNA (cytidine1409-2'-O)-methyltransferase